MNTAAQISFSLIAAEKRSRFNPLANLTPEKLTQFLDQFRAGHLRPLAQVIEAIEERDDVLATVVPKTKAAVARHGWEILTVDTLTESEASQALKQKEVLERFYNSLRATSAIDQDELGGVKLLLRQMMDAKGKRYSVHHLVWEPGPDGYRVRAIHVPLWFFENAEGRLRFIRDAYGVYGVDLEPGAWMVTKGLGVGIACAVAWMFKHLPLRDWLIYCARHGMPGIEGVTDAPEGSEEWNKLMSAVSQAASEFAWVRSRSSEIKAIEWATSGELPYPALVDRMDRALAALWRGADLSTKSAGQGQGQGASLQGGESDLIEQDDAEWLSETLQLRLDRLVLDYTFGPEVPALAYFHVTSAQKENLELDLKVDEFALRSGHPISRQQFAERYSRPIPEDGDELLTGGVTAPQRPGGHGEKDPQEAAANEATISAINAALAMRLGVPPGWLAPIQDLRPNEH
ncbi:MAG: phage portal protein family protein [Limisphaerales bacterium]